MWLRIASRYPVGLIDEPLALLRRHENSLTAKEAPLETFDGIMYVAKLAIKRDEERLGNMKKGVLSYRYLAIGKGLSRMGRISEARAMFIQAIRNDPLSIRAYFYYLVSIFFPIIIIQQLHALNVFWRKSTAKRILKTKRR